MQVTSLLLPRAPELSWALSCGICLAAFLASVTLPPGLLQDLFAKHINFEPMAAQIMAPKERKMTPKMFAYQLTQRCLQNPQHIVLPEVRGCSGLPHEAPAPAVELTAPLVCQCKSSG